MRIETSKQAVELGEMVTSAVKVTDAKGMERAELVEEFILSGKTADVTTTDIYADKGKVFRRKEDGAVLSTHITVGTEDSAGNYEEVTLKVIRDT